MLSAALGALPGMASLIFRVRWEGRRGQRRGAGESFGVLRGGGLLDRRWWLALHAPGGYQCYSAAVVDHLAASPAVRAWLTQPSPRGDAGSH
jgi:hypothetical protein